MNMSNIFDLNRKKVFGFVFLSSLLVTSVLFSTLYLNEMNNNSGQDGETNIDLEVDSDKERMNDNYLNKVQISQGIGSEFNQEGWHSDVNVTITDPFSEDDEYFDILAKDYDLYTRHVAFNNIIISEPGFNIQGDLDEGEDIQVSQGGNFAEIFEEYIIVTSDYKGERRVDPEDEGWDFYDPYGPCTLRMQYMLEGMGSYDGEGVLIVVSEVLMRGGASLPNGAIYPIPVSLETDDGLILGTGEIGSTSQYGPKTETIRFDMSKLEYDDFYGMGELRLRFTEMPILYDFELRIYVSCLYLPIIKMSDIRITSINYTVNGFDYTDTNINLDYISSYVEPLPTHVFQDNQTSNYSLGYLKERLNFSSLLNYNPPGDVLVIPPQELEIEVFCKASDFGDETLWTYTLEFE